MCFYEKISEYLCLIEKLIWAGNMIFCLIFQAYIFDIRSGTYSHKLTGHTDVVADVDFHPLIPQVQCVS